MDVENPVREFVAWLCGVGVLAIWAVWFALAGLLRNAPRLLRGRTRLKGEALRARLRKAPRLSRVAKFIRRLKIL